MPTCPICKKPLAEGEKFLMEFYPPLNWWVFEHVLEYSEGYSEDSDPIDGRYQSIIKYKGYCGRADVRLYEDKRPLSGTEWIGFRS